MKTCPACHRAVPDHATVCPHAGCGQPLAAPSGGAKKRPPPPGKVQLTTTAVQPTPGTSTATAADDSRRGPLATIALLLLLFLLVGGVYYAAVLSKSPSPGPVAAAPADSATAPDAQASKGDGAASKDRDAKAADGDTEPLAKEPPSAEENMVAPPELKELAPIDEKTETDVAAATPSQPLGLYSERTRPDRETWITGVGGTPVSETAVAAGLDWLSRHQAEDGHWGPDCLGAGGSCCEKAHPCDGGGLPFEAALTGLALLAFQAGGHYDFNDRPNSDRVRRGLDWLVARQGPNGELVGSTNQLGNPPTYDQHYMYEHAIGTFALAEACAVARAAGRHPDEKYHAAATKAIEFLESQQHNDGGWRYTPDKWSASDASVSGWAMLALKTAKEADLPVQDATLTRMLAFFKQLSDPLTGRTHYQGVTYVSDATTGVGMMVDEFVKHEPDSELVHLASSYLADQAEGQWGGAAKQPSDHYLWYNCTLAMFMAGGDNWDRWNKVVRDYIVSLQLHGENCNRGSWEPHDDHWGSIGGRVYTTALGVLTLEVYYRFAREKAVETAEAPK
ncbi:MAG TPA: prenyltransferase/squalene oxidase repeat-containing protein [Pirellulales bacterium]|nr:prenyltransferase/squalene oxidase repeat-containing protein [Pirellulales bacterium]